MKHVYILVLAAALSAPLAAAPAKHRAHHASSDPVLDAKVRAATADMQRERDQADDGSKWLDAYVSGDRQGAADLRVRMDKRECEDHDLYMHAYEAASPADRQLLHERCYGSRGK